VISVASKLIVSVAVGLPGLLELELEEDDDEDELELLELEEEGLDEGKEELELDE
jgi:hypothetical protein